MSETDDRKPTQEEMDQMTHEFTRAMRDCRRRVQERMNDKNPGWYRGFDDLLVKK